MTLLQVKTVDLGWEVWAQLDRVQDEEVFVYMTGTSMPGRPSRVMQKMFNEGKELTFRITEGMVSVVPERTFAVSGLHWGGQMIGEPLKFEMTLVQT